MPILEVGGNWMNGMISQTFRNRMKKKSVPRNGGHAPAVGPMMSLVMPRSTNSYDISTMFCSPRGTNCILREPLMNRNTRIADDANTSSDVWVLADGVP